MQHFPRSVWVLIGLTGFGLPARAELSLSIPPQTLLPNVAGEYAITQDLGVTAGNNLFHSFQTFNINPGETATFSGNSTIQNVISRVTGGSPSSIDGVLKNTIPGANTYLLNPAGVLFGAQARLEVQGSFYASTADTLKFSDGAEFFASPSGSSAFSSAPPAAFGFLGETQAGIATQNSTLAVPEGKTLGLFGGNIEARGPGIATPDAQGFYVMANGSMLAAPDGEVLLSSASGPADVPLDGKLPAGAQGGQISLDKTLLEASGSQGGAITLHGGRLETRDATLQSNTLGEGPGRGVHIEMRESVDMTGPVHTMPIKSFGTGNAGSLFVKAPDIGLHRVGIGTSTFGPGNSGTLTFEAERMVADQGSLVGGPSYGAGKGGDIRIHASERLVLADRREDIFIGNNSWFIQHPTVFGSSAASSGPAGMTEIDAGELLLDQGMLVSVSYFSGTPASISVRAASARLINAGLISADGYGTGGAGDIEVDVAGDLTISGVRKDPYIGLNGLTYDGLRSGIHALLYPDVPAGALSGQTRVRVGGTLTVAEGAVISTATASKADAGDVAVEAGDLRILSGGGIMSNNQLVFAGGTTLTGAGGSGDVQVRATRSIEIEGREAFLISRINTDTTSAGHGGSLSVDTPRLVLRNLGRIIAYSSGEGDAGDIRIRAGEILLEPLGLISTQSARSGGGNIQLSVDRLLYAQNGEISTSVSGGAGAGGNIEINPPRFALLNQSRITAQADAGQGGNIRLVADHFLRTPDSLVSASSRLGVDGKIEIDSPLAEVSESMFTVAGQFLRTSELSPQNCHAPNQPVSRFVLMGAPDGRPLAPEDLLY